MTVSASSNRARFRTRKMGQSIARILSLHRRYGTDVGAFSRILNDFAGLTESLGATVTFPVPGRVLEKHPALFSSFQGRGVELAMHGYVHWDFSRMPPEWMEAQVEKTRSVFERFGIASPGFRFPYLRKAEGALSLLSACGVPWDSSDSVFWNVIDFSEVRDSRRKAFERIRATYAPEYGERSKCLPRFIGGMVEIPVSLPDDDMLIDRLGIRDPKRMYRTWRDAFDRAGERGCAFVLQLHPERFPLFRVPLRKLLEDAAGRSDVWVAGLGEIAEWWNERGRAKFTVVPAGQGLFRVICRGSGRVGLSICRGRRETRMPPGAPAGRNSLSWIVPADRPPRIPDPDGESKDGGPFLATPPWPEGKRCALAVSGDIDCVDVWDFWNRLHD
jgi:peptidoglycan/xylan/chitin deacetylase (PgdA/CDA1 family)